MSEPKHTPGPWGVSDSRTRDYKPREQFLFEMLEICALDTNADKLVCVARIDHRVNKLPIDEEDMSNANLIAAAPDMYEALKCACDQYCIGYAGDSIVKCEDCIIANALRKAKGEGR